jgi:superfamily I DNA/RNA helicase/RecB family exonuclease
VPPTVSYRLVRSAVAAPPVPILDTAQQSVVAHNSGPLLVLAGPGTGKTTTLVEAVVARVEAGADPDRVLVLTFSRKAADELRERIAARLGRTVTEPAAYTFHGFCHAVVRAWGQPAADRAQGPRLLSGAERELRVRELLAGNAAGEGTTRWPVELVPALRLRGFAREVADLLDRARERGLSAADLHRLGVAHDRPAWVAAGDFLEEYLDVLAIRDEVDYAALVSRATELLDGPAAPLRERFVAVYVDEYQDTDPAQERLLARLAGDGRLLVAVGDPDQSIYGFRGADVDNILEFPRRFHAADGSEAPVVALQTCRRMGPELLGISREFARRIPLGSLTSRRGAHRGLTPGGPDAVEPPRIRLFPTMAEQATAIADVLRRAHLAEGMPWREMAVLVRSGVRSIPVLRRALTAAGVPVAVAADEVPLAHDPALAPLLTALEVVRRDSALTPDAAQMLLLSPLAGASPGALRALGRQLRALDAAGGGGLPKPAALLVRDALLDPGDLELLDHWSVEPARRLARLLAKARAVAADVDAGRAAADEVLWVLWDGSGWARRLAAASATGGAAGRAADRDLDAVLGLFEAASRLEDRRPRAGLGALLEEIAAQEIPAAPLDERSARQDAVRLLTAHRSKGGEWDLVVVADAQDGVWPDVRRRGSLLEADALAPGGPREVSNAALLAEERRLFYVALTRARRRLVVTAVAGVDDDAERPSRFLDELGLDLPPTELAGTGLLAPSSLVARLRRALADPASSEHLRALAATELAALANATGPDGEPLVAPARPDSWWGLRAPTTGAAPVRPADVPVVLSGSAVSAHQRCPRAWFLDREAHASAATSSSQGLGSVVHAIAEAVATGELPADLDVLERRLAEIWPSLPFDARWQADREWEEARRLLRRFVCWHEHDERELLGVEVDFTVAHSADVVLRGRADRLERDSDGRVVVVDLKTGRTAPVDRDLPREPQLGVYQLAVRDGAFADRYAGAPGGAELVQLRREVRGAVKVQSQPAMTADDDWCADLVDTTAATIRAEQFDARPNDGCDRCPFRGSCPAHPSGGQVVP